jgi:hypothetical protein
MWKWFRNFDSDDVKMVISGAVAVIAFVVLVLAWSIDNYRRQECDRNCTTDLSAQRRY